MLALAPAPRSAAETPPPTARLAAPIDLELRLEQAYRAFLPFQFFRCDAPTAVERVRAASERFSALQPRVTAAIGRERAAELLEPLQIDPELAQRCPHGLGQAQVVE